MTAIDENTKAAANPTKGFFVGMLTRDITLEDCILDLIDNSVDGAWRSEGSRPMGLAEGADLSKYSIRITASPERFSITDDCGGMTLSDAIDHAFSFGRQALDEPSAYSIGVYGIGMKVCGGRPSAARWFRPRLPRDLLGPFILDAADYGAATKRPRLFVIGMHKDKADPLKLEDVTCLERDPATVKAAIADLLEAAPIGEEDEFDVWQIVRPGRPSDYALLRHFFRIVDQVRPAFFVMENVPGKSRAKFASDSCI